MTKTLVRAGKSAMVLFGGASPLLRTGTACQQNAEQKGQQPSVGHHSFSADEGAGHYISKKGFSSTRMSATTSAEAWPTPQGALGSPCGPRVPCSRRVRGETEHQTAPLPRCHTPRYQCACPRASRQAVSSSRFSGGIPASISFCVHGPPSDCTSIEAQASASLGRPLGGLCPGRCSSHA